MTDEMNNNHNGAYEEPHNEETDERNPFDEFVEKQKVAAEEFTKALEEIFPPSFREHTRKAGEAFIDSFKSLFDSTFQDLEEKFQNRRDAKSEDGDDNGNTKVRVDVE